MDEPFKPKLKPHELPRETIVDLWRRTVVAHEHLRETWFAAVEKRYGHHVAEEVALEGWPLLRDGASPKQLFFDDLRFIVAAAELKPDMLTVAEAGQAPVPAEISGNRGWFELFIRASSLVRGKHQPESDAPVWTGSPGPLRGLVRGKGIELGFTALLKAWQACQGERAREIDVDAFDRRVSEDFDANTLALLWNYAALAYMLATDRWYTGVRKRYGDEIAQELEKDVWIDRGAAEYDLQIGQAAMSVTGDDVEALLRSFQFAPGEVGILDVELELHDANHGTLTHHACPALDRFEHFDDIRLGHCCDICVAAMPISGEMLNRKIECRPLKLPPRRDAKDIACKWEYRLRDRS